MQSATKWSLRDWVISMLYFILWTFVSEKVFQMAFLYGSFSSFPFYFVSISILVVGWFHLFISAQVKVIYFLMIVQVLIFMWLKFFLIWRYFRFWSLVGICKWSFIYFILKFGLFSGCCLLYVVLSVICVHDDLTSFKY